MSYELTINGTTYVTDSKEAFNALNDVKDNPDKVDEVLSDYGKTIKESSTDEDELIEVEENIVENDTNVEEIETSIEEDSDTISEELGYSALTEESDVFDMEEVYNKIDGKMDEVETLLNGVDYENPENVNEALDTAMGLYSVILQLSSSLGVEVDPDKMTKVPTKCNKGHKKYQEARQWGWALTPTILFGGIAFWVAGARRRKAEDKLEELQSGIKDKTRSMEDMIDEAKEKFKDATEDGVISRLNDSFKNLMNGNFTFKDPTSIQEILENYDMIEKGFIELNPYLQVAEKFDIDLNDLKDLEKAIGSKETMTSFMQQNLEDYLRVLSNEITTDDTLINDTDSLNKIHDKLSTLSDTSEKRGLNTNNITDLMEDIEKLNEKEVENEEEEIETHTTTETTSSGSGSGITYIQEAASATEASQIAADNAAGVSESATSYDVSTDGLESLVESKKDEAQTAVSSYLDETTTSGLSMEELEALYGEVSTNKEAFAEVSSELDLSGFEPKLEEIRAAQQDIVNTWAEEMTTEDKSIEELQTVYDDAVAKEAEVLGITDALDVSPLTNKATEAKDAQQTAVNTYTEETTAKVEGSTQTSERVQYNTEVNNYITQYGGFNLDLSGVEALLPMITQKEQEAIAVRNQEYNQSAEASQTSQEVAVIVNNINIDIANVQVLNCDVTELTNTVNVLNAKVLEMQAQEATQEDPEATEETETDTKDESGIIVDSSGVHYVDTENKEETDMGTESDEVPAPEETTTPESVPTTEDTAEPEATPESVPATEDTAEPEATPESVPVAEEEVPCEPEEELPVGQNPDIEIADGDEIINIESSELDEELEENI